ncbi:hypothetical protein CROQUDRAFT_107734 [Cronartium quercuum f. sp. fusiforme G11]|uniref:Uncharacterized protein n=1 Tax=Cronartium quercuum f. sp. fusiforme G11 TaxID=708437 RepID=A0A9P6NJZ6_9BASI|nr:hypothetical protein CROQUDRAFT_107734 [Cronartium quercuum f. sp. fusiforme G11]
MQSVREPQPTDWFPYKGGWIQKQHMCLDNAGVQHVGCNQGIPPLAPERSSQVIVSSNVSPTVGYSYSIQQSQNPFHKTTPLSSLVAHTVLSGSYEQDLPASADIEVEIIAYSPDYEDPMEGKGTATKKRKNVQWLPWTLPIHKHTFNLSDLDYNNLKKQIFTIASVIDKRQPNGNTAILHQADELACAKHGLVATNQEHGLETTAFEVAEVHPVTLQAQCLADLVKKHGTTTTNSKERWHMYNPQDLTQFVRLDHQWMSIWAYELAQNKEGVTLVDPPMYIEGWAWETIEVRPLTDSAPPLDQKIPSGITVPTTVNDSLHLGVNPAKLDALQMATSLEEFLIFAGIPIDKVGDLALTLEDMEMSSFDLFLYTEHIDLKTLQAGGVKPGFAIRLLTKAYPFYLYMLAHCETASPVRLL